MKTAREFAQWFATYADGWYFETDEDAKRHDEALEYVIGERDAEHAAESKAREEALRKEIERSAVRERALGEAMHRAQDDAAKEAADANRLKGELADEKKRSDALESLVDTERQQRKEVANTLFFVRKELQKTKGELAEARRDYGLLAKEFAKANGAIDGLKSQLVSSGKLAFGLAMGMPANKRPTIETLEKILAQEESAVRIETNPDGSIRAVPADFSSQGASMSAETKKPTDKSSCIRKDCGHSRQAHSSGDCVMDGPDGEQCWCRRFLQACDHGDVPNGVPEKCPCDSSCSCRRNVCVTQLAAPSPASPPCTASAGMCNSPRACSEAEKCIDARMRETLPAEPTGVQKETNESVLRKRAFYEMVEAAGPLPSSAMASAGPVQAPPDDIREDAKAWAETATHEFVPGGRAPNGDRDLCWAVEGHMIKTRCWKPRSAPIHTGAKP